MRHLLLATPILLSASPLLAQSASGGPADILSCVHSLRDAGGGGCVEASSVPTFGMLCPLSADFFIDAATGNVGVNTTAPAAKLHVTGNFDDRILVEQSGAPFLDPSATWVDENIRIVDGDAQIALYSDQSGGASGAIFMKEVAGDGTISSAWEMRRLTNDHLEFAHGTSNNGGDPAVMSLSPAGDVGIGNTAPTQQLDIGGKVQMDSNLFGGNNGTITTTTGAGDATGYLGPVAGGTYVNGIVDINGFVSGGALYDPVADTTTIFGNVKNFRETNPANPQTDIVYACIEGPEAAAYQRGTARLIDGAAVVELPAHFAAVASEENLTVQLTPRSARSRGLAVVEQSASGFVVRELMDGRGSYEFAWEIKAVRKGYEDYQVIRPKLVRPHRARDLEQR